MIRSQANPCVPLFAGRFASLLHCAIALAAGLPFATGVSFASDLGAAIEASPVQLSDQFDDDGVRTVPRRMMFHASRWRFKDSPSMRDVFRDVVREASEATLCVHVNGKHAVLGSIVGSDGWVLTKASPLRGEIVCRLNDQRKLSAEIVHTNSDYDLALLKIDATGLSSLSMELVDRPQVGSWLATIGKDQVPAAVGVMSVAPREIPRQYGVLGVELTVDAPLVTQVFRDSGAEEAGVQVNDRIVKVNGTPTLSRNELQRVIRSYSPGDQIELTVQRGGEDLTLKAFLAGEIPGWTSRMDFQNNLGGSLSVRRFGFPSAFQHDTVLRPVDCGGPVVNLDGKAVGINIARAGRTETYALPIDVVAPLVKDWIEAAQRVHVVP